jgi:hypothetical protein
MLTLDEYYHHRHRIRELEKAIESLTLTRDVVTKYYVHPSTLRSASETSGTVLERIEEELVRKNKELERLKIETLPVKERILHAH